MRKVSNQVWKKSGKRSFQERMFSAKKFIWTLRKQFWDPSQLFPRNGRKFFSQCRIFIKKKIEIFPSRCSFGNIKCSFDNPAQNFLEECRKIFAQGLKRIKKPNFSKRNNFPRNVLVETKIAVMTNTLEKFRHKARFFPPVIGK